MPFNNFHTSFKLTNQEFESLLCFHLGPDVNVEDFKIQALTKPGENYGSTILTVELTITKNHIKSKFPLVVKLVPPSEFLRKAFDIEITFNKEVNAYKLVVPELELLQKEKEIRQNKLLDIFPKFYGARTNKKGDSEDKADDTAILLLENLKISGYETGDRIEGLNLKHMELGVSKLAQFHAVSVALKILKPEVFRDTVIRACDKCVIGGIADNEMVEKLVTATVNDMKHIPECLPYIEKIERIIREDLKEKTATLSSPPKQPFATFVHNDFWVNNMMFKYENVSGNENVPSKNKTPISMKFVDFQITRYASPICDLIFFIYSSAADDIIKSKFDDLINLYHHEFIDCISSLKCDIEPFSLENFRDELNLFAPKELPHILYMTKFISADKSKVPDLSNCDADVMLLNNYGGELYIKKTTFLILDFVQRGWL